MYRSGKVKNPRSFQVILDVIHVFLCLVIVALTVFLFLDPEGHSLFFPLIFFLAAALNMVAAVARWKRTNKTKFTNLQGVFFALLALVLLVLSVMSGIAVWRTL